MTLHLAHTSNQRGRLTQAEHEGIARVVQAAREQRALDEIRHAVRSRIRAYYRRRALRQAVDALLFFFGLRGWRRLP